MTQSNSLPSDSSRDAGEASGPSSDDTSASIVDVLRGARVVRAQRLDADGNPVSEWFDIPPSDPQIGCDR